MLFNPLKYSILQVNPDHLKKVFSGLDFFKHS